MRSPALVLNEVKLYLTIAFWALSKAQSRVQQWVVVITAHELISPTMQCRTDVGQTVHMYRFLLPV